MIGDLNINCLTYNEKDDTKQFFDNIFQHGIMPIINKPTRVTSKSITAIDNILTNIMFDSSLKVGIVKTDISDHFPIYFSINTEQSIAQNSTVKIKKRVYDKNNTKIFKEELNSLNWQSVIRESERGNTDSAYKDFLKLFLGLYDKNFPLQEFELKQKTINSPWITSGIKKSSKQKQKLYVKYLKNRNDSNLYIYKNYKNLFEKVKKQSKKQHYSKLLIKNQGDMKATWRIMKEIIGKSKVVSSTLPRRVIVNKEEIYDQNIIAEKFNNFFVNVGPSLASKIPNTDKKFENYFETTNNLMSFGELTNLRMTNLKKLLKLSK